MNRFVAFLPLLVVFSTSCSQSRSFCEFDTEAYRHIMTSAEPKLMDVFHPVALAHAEKSGGLESLKLHYIEYPKAVLRSRFSSYDFEEYKIFLEDAERREWDEAIIEEMASALQIERANIVVHDLVIVDASENAMRFRHYFSCWDGQLMILALNPDRHQNVRVP